MPRIARQPGDARLSRDGTVKLEGAVVGVWWRDDYHWYHFADNHGEEPGVSRFFRHELMSAIAEHVKLGTAEMPKPRSPRRRRITHGHQQDWRATIRECDDLTLASALEKAIDKLFEEDLVLLASAVHERTIAAALARHMQGNFSSSHVDVEYNKLGDDPKRIATHGESRIVVPDIIVHTRGNPLHGNLIAIELKRGRGGNTDEDTENLRQMRKDLHYAHALFIRFGDRQRAGSILEMRWVTD